MTRTTEAVYSNGVLKPAEPLPLREQERVRITVETVEQTGAGRSAAIARLVEGFSKLRLRTNGRLPPREELHERG